jgi:hypothetical protein
MNANAKTKNKMGGIKIPNFYGSPLHDKKRQRMIIEAFDEEEGTVEDNSFKTQKLNDPKNILSRKPTNREYKKGYKTKKEKDGSITIKGKKG